MCKESIVITQEKKTLWRNQNVELTRLFKNIKKTKAKDKTLCHQIDNFNKETEVIKMYKVEILELTQTFNRKFEWAKENF